MINSLAHAHTCFNFQIIRRRPIVGVYRLLLKSIRIEDMQEPVKTILIITDKYIKLGIICFEKKNRVVADVAGQAAGPKNQT